MQLRRFSGWAILLVTTGLDHRQNCAVGCQLEREGAAHNQPHAHCLSVMKAIHIYIIDTFVTRHALTVHSQLSLPKSNDESSSGSQGRNDRNCLLLLKRLSETESE